jgi:hypothetical protein
LAIIFSIVFTLLNDKIFKINEGATRRRTRLESTPRTRTRTGSTSRTKTGSGSISRTTNRARSNDKSRHVTAKKAEADSNAKVGATPEERAKARDQAKANDEKIYYQSFKDANTAMIKQAEVLATAIKTTFDGINKSMSQSTSRTHEAAYAIIVKDTSLPQVRIASKEFAIKYEVVKLKFRDFYKHIKIYDKPFYKLLIEVKLDNIYTLNNNIRILLEYILEPTKYEATKAFTDKLHLNTVDLYTDLMINGLGNLFYFIRTDNRSETKEGYIPLVYIPLTEAIDKYMNDKKIGTSNISEGIKKQNDDQIVVPGTNGSMRKYVDRSNDILKKYYDKDGKKMFKSNKPPMRSPAT